MFFIDELDNFKLYKKPFLLPLNEKDKKKNSMAILMGTNLQSSIDIMQYPIMNPRYYVSYYLERAVMYYINQESNTVDYDEEVIVTESIEDLIEKNDNKIIIKGYSHDVDNVKRYLSKSIITKLAEDYHVKIKYPITVDIVSRSQKKENTKNQIWLLPQSMYNSSLKSYEMYVHYNVIELILCNTCPEMNQQYKYALALYDSGLADLHKDKWIFGDSLKVMCREMKKYEDTHGHKRLVRDMISDPNTIFFDAAKDTLKKSLLDIFYETKDFKEKINTNDAMQLNESMILAMPIHEDSAYNSHLKKMLYTDRFKSLEELKKLYEDLKVKVPYIKYTYTSIERYKQLNLFVDLSHYMYSFIKNSTLKREKGYKLFSELMERLINDKRYSELGYKNKTVIIPIDDWNSDEIDKLWMINESINPISCLYYTIKSNPAKLKSLYADTTFLFTSSKGYFKIDFGTADHATAVQRIMRNIKMLTDKNAVIPNEDDDNRESSPRAIKTDLVDKVEKAQGIEINDISTEPKDDSKKTDTEEDKEKLVQTVAKAAEKSNNEEDTLDKLDQDDELKEIIANLSANADNKSNISDARASRMIKLQNDIMDKKFKDKTIRQLTEVDYDHEELKEKAIPVDSVNEEWSQLKSITQEEIYDMDSDIVQIFNQFADKDYPLVVRDIKVEDNSTSENATLLYTVQYESADGKRFSVKVDIPKWIDNKYLILGGNKKDIPNQLFLMPISKTETDTVQIVSNYNKIFIRRFGATSGKSFITCDRLIKTISKNEFKNLVVSNGDNTKICNRYELPIDYIDFASTYSKLSTPSKVIYFNQDTLRDEYGDKIDEKNGIPIGIEKGKTGVSILYYNSTVGKEKEFMSFSQYLLLLLETDKDLSKEGFKDAYENTNRSVRYTYSRASILNTEIPLIVVCAYSEGLTKVLDKANIKYRLESNKRNINPETEDFIKYNDAYLIYNLDYASSLLLNGLKSCPTSEYSVGDIDTKSMYIEFLDGFGGRIKADGLDNFYNLMIDKPITYNALQYYNLPTDYVEVLLYANRLLADNKFTKHSRINDNRRTRRQEQVAAILYKQLSGAYESYANNMKHGRYSPLSMKQSAVVDETLKNSTTSDKSVLNALGEYEAYATITPKGPCGMNSDRSYTLDKRSFDSSMLNVMGMSTGFAGNVGIARQLTIDANISTARGYIKGGTENIDEINPTKTLCMTEALTPFGSTRDDPFRTAMTFIQTSKHGIRCKRSNPNLITTGADEALPYMISNIFAFKAKGKGTIKDINDERMIVEYDDGTYDYVDLTERIEKNSSSGFYGVIKLDTDLKVGNKVKEGQIIAYDKESFSSDFGENDNLSYNIGTMCKFAMLNTDEGFEDSAIISEDLSEDMTSDIILKIDKVFDKNTNIYNMVSVGQEIEEGDTLLIAQAAYDEEDVNTLLRNLTVDDEDEVTDLGKIPIKSKVTGVVQDIKIFRTVDIDELSPTLKKIVNAYEKKINAKKKEMKSYDIDNVETIVGSTGKLPATGRLKNADNGVLIEFYLKYEDRFSVGDKLIYYSANKGVAKDIFPRGKEPKSEFRPNEKIHTLLSKGSVDGRMVCSIMINGGILKGVIELSRKCKDILGIKYDDNLFGK